MRRTPPVWGRGIPLQPSMNIPRLSDAIPGRAAAVDMAHSRAAPA
jgi:hypothetical protein